MAQYIVEFYLTKLNYIFLIQSSKLACPSYYRYCIRDPGKEMNISHYDFAEVGEARSLFDYVYKYGLSGSNALAVIDGKL